MPNPEVAVIGSGYWGKNLVRTFHELGALRWVCDSRQSVLNQTTARLDVNTTTSVEDVLDDVNTGAVAIATPAACHFEVAKKCLLAGKDVYVEKPLALRASEGEELVNIAARRGRILMVGHILQYHPAVLELKRKIDSGELGKIQYIYSSRLNLGKLRTEENILWSFAPHDISAILFLLGEVPDRISTTGGSYLNGKQVDATLTTMVFRSGVNAHIFVSWLHPYKEQKLTIVGGRNMAVFDDVEPENKLVIYPHRIAWLARVPVATKGDGQIVAIPHDEPLRRECEHFLECISKRMTPRTNGESGVQVLKVLEACERSLHEMGQPVDVALRTSKYQAHPTAVIDEGCEIGEGTRVWHFSHVMSGARIGKNCKLGQNVVVSSGVTIGDNVKIQNNVSVYTGVEIEDDVFCGPSMVFTNVINPRSHIERKHEYKKTLVRRGASIGANATIRCGTSLGEYCFIAAGAVVTRDVPAFSLMVGVPARRVGWVCYCGVRLPDAKSSQVVCPACQRNYSVTADTCAEAFAPHTLIQAAA